MNIPHTSSYKMSTYVSALLNVCFCTRLPEKNKTMKILHFLFNTVSLFDSSNIYLAHFRLVAWCNGNAFDPINEVTVRRAGLVLRWVTACGQINHLGMQPAA